MADLLPQDRQRVVGPDGTPTVPYYLFFRALAERLGNDTALELIRRIAIALGSPDGSVERIPPIASGSFLPISTRVEGEFSVDYSGTLESGLVRLSLVNDEFEPLPTSYYGTGPLGEKGWRTIASAFLPGVGITLTEDLGGSGVITVALAELADGGGGLLLKFARDEYGRVAGTSAATTDDLTEGAVNLYFTDARAVNALETTGPDYLQLLLDQYDP